MLCAASMESRRKRCCTLGFEQLVRFGKQNVGVRRHCEPKTRGKRFWFIMG